MRFLMFLFLFFIFYTFCESRNTELYSDEEHAAMVCTEPIVERPNWYTCTGHSGVRFFNRIKQGKELCVDEIIIDDIPYYFCARRIPITDGPFELY